MSMPPYNENSPSLHNEYVCVGARVRGMGRITEGW